MKNRSPFEKGLIRSYKHCIHTLRPVLLRDATEILKATIMKNPERIRIWTVIYESDIEAMEKYKDNLKYVKEGKFDEH